MLDDKYFIMNNAHALKRLGVKQALPNKNLGVADDEVKNSQPVLVFTDFHADRNTRAVMDTRKSAIEYTGTIGDGLTVEQTDFYNDVFYLGSAVEVV